MGCSMGFSHVKTDVSKSILITLFQNEIFLQDQFVITGVSVCLCAFVMVFYEMTETFWRKAHEPITSQEREKYTASLIR